MNKEKLELRNLSTKQLVEKVELLRREFFTLKLNALNTHIKDYSQFNKLRKNIARAMTYLQQKTEQTH